MTVKATERQERRFKAMESTVIVCAVDKPQEVCEDECQ
jgi:hypothetical protein